MTIKQDVQKLEPGALIELYHLDGADIGGSSLFFHAQTQAGPIFWKGQQYDPWPIKADGFAKTSDKQPQPKLTVANLEGTISELCRLYDDLVGAKLTRIRTMGKYLDHENFGKTNMLVWSEAFDNAAWVKTSGLTVLASAGPDPLGGSSADRINVTGAAQGLYQVVTVVPGTTYTYSQWVQLGTMPVAQFKFGIYNHTANTWIADSVTPDITLNTTTMQRMTYTFTAPAGCTQVRVYPFRNAGTPTAGTSAYLWGAMLNVGEFAMEYERKDAGGYNPTMDTNQEFPREVWYIERKASESNDAVQFELVTAFDLNGVRLPRRQIIANYCTWMSVGGYRGPYCGYTGPAVAKADDTPTSDPVEDMCSGKLAGCRLRQWPDGVLNFGGFPAAGLMRT